MLATTDYGLPVTAAVRCGNVWGTQFHPEKSSQAGFRLLRNFISGGRLLKMRVIPTLLWKQFGLGQGVGFDSWRRVGPCCRRSRSTTSAKWTNSFWLISWPTDLTTESDFESIDEFGQDCFVPLTVGGGITRIDQVQRLLRAGADKVSINSPRTSIPNSLRR